ncbi:DUF3152 domain-containing protein [Nocardioides sp. InS609-2]|uniref:DUF3152 domain-containing protein n=1 Tax=Nocardioides sp. InS609-2 TaxID=2760705 RepID=UPI0020C128D7|nr:DUF3152 domain-containing protein [Nocardioides sp. InS609-2]
MRLRHVHALLTVVLLAPVPAVAAPVQEQAVPLVNTEPPVARGVARFTHTLRAHPGRWTPQRTTTTYQWLRDGQPIKAATDRRYDLAPDDVGTQVQVVVSAAADGYEPAAAVSRPRKVKYRVDRRRVATYNVETRGRVAASMKEFRRQVQQTYDDPRGWRNGGVQFRRVARGADFTLVLAEASWLPRMSGTCSAMWSCRVGRFVIINQARWLGASPAWNSAGRSVRDYRHLVVNHETGHWLGHGHAGCPGPGQLAPVMMQQSKTTGGCRFNPWPRPGEL